MTEEDKWEKFKQNFYEFIWNIFIFVRVPIVLVWMALIIGILIGTYM